MLTRLNMHVNAKIKKNPNKAIIKTISQDALTKHVDVSLTFRYELDTFQESNLDLDKLFLDHNTLSHLDASADQFDSF